MLGASDPGNGGILGWADSSRKPIRKATYGLLGMVPQSSVAKPVNWFTKNGVQMGRGTGAPALRCLCGAQRCLAGP